MRRDLAVVESPAFTFRIHLGKHPGQVRQGFAEQAQGLRSLGKLLVGQVTAIGPVVGDGLVLLAQRLGQGQGFLGIDAVGLAHVHLQVEQRERQGCWGLLFLHSGIGHVCGLHSARVSHLNSVCHVDDPVLVIERGISGNDEAGLRTTATKGQACRNRVVKRTGVTLVGQVAVHDQSQNRGLYATYRQHAFDALGPTGQGAGAGHVEPVQLITDAAGQCLLEQTVKLAVVAQAVQRFAGGIGVHVVDQDAFDRRGVAEMHQDLVDQQLAFVVRVTGVDDFRGATDQLLDHFELVASARNGLVLGRAQLQGQVGLNPVFIIGVVHLRRGQFKQVAHAPGDDIVAAALEIAVLAYNGAQRLGNDLAQGGLFRNEYSHGVLLVRIWGLAPDLAELVVDFLGVALISTGAAVEVVLARRGGLAPFDVPVLLDQDAEVVLFGAAAFAATAVAGEFAVEAQHGLARVTGEG
ncbi:hypothetical protein ALP24_05669 [Pseudomonas syringae pv. aptata]|uniref:Uncharacterized protein n=1 Tax=Pseudomonas syringae pv. aptata TaxID=83167 RepID=A0A3M5X4D7_PSEAP|nr:hypothetical protein ALP24_05669 [Pseudomonas syringae pv. aptata]